MGHETESSFIWRLYGLHVGTSNSGVARGVQYPLIREYTLNPTRNSQQDLRYIPRLRDIGLPGRSSRDNKHFVDW